MRGESPTAFVTQGGTTSGLIINLHPLPILNVSEHYNRTQLTSGQDYQLIGVLLGTQSNREVAVVNSFELIYATPHGDVVMSENNASGSRSTDELLLNVEFLETRKEQFKQVFPALDVIGWYSVGEQPTAEHSALHLQFTEHIDTPIFLLLDPNPVPGSQALPVKVYEAALAESTKEGGAGGKFVELEYGIETGEAERIAVDGVSRGGMGGEGEESTVVANLTTQRNAIRMLYDRIAVLLQYITSVVDKSAKPDHNILRQISALVATLPTIDAQDFQDELRTEYSDVQLTSYLHTLTKQLNALSDYADKHNLLHPPPSDDLGRGQGGQRSTRPTGGFDAGGSGGRRRR